MTIGKSAEIRRGKQVAILNFGTLLQAGMRATGQLDATVVDMRWVKPLDSSIVIEIATRHELLVTLEDNSIAGGAGSGVYELQASRNIQVGLLNLGIPDVLMEHGSQREQHSRAELDADNIYNAVTCRLRQQSKDLDREPNTTVSMNH
jgi:1-deoxy-D-xylulose-5-phosphate synthase